MSLARWLCGGVGVPLAATLMSGCMLGNINADECSSDLACEQLFGLGSTCGAEGYCSEPASCSSSVECRAQFGFGASCQDSQCVVLPNLESRCVLSEPESLLYELPGRLGDRILLGGLFAIDTEKHRVRADATRLAIRQINNLAGGIMGRQLGVLICNNDSDGDSANDTQEMEELTRYLAGDLAVPVILGPTSSSASIIGINLLLQERLATAFISPSATSPQLTDHTDRLDPGDPHGLFWRTCPSDALQGKVLAMAIARETLILPGVDPDLDQIAVIFQNDAYGSGLQLVFRTEFEAIDTAHSVSAVSFEVDESDLQDAVNSAAGSGADAVLVISSDATRTLHAIEFASGTSLSTLPLFLTDGSKDAAVLLSSSNDTAIQTIVRGAIGTAPASPEGTAFEVFRESLLHEFNSDASQFSFVGHSYDAAFVGAYGIIYASHAATDFDGRLVADGMALLASGDAITVGNGDFSRAVSALSVGTAIDIEGTSGPLDFDPTTGEAPGDIEIWVVCEPDNPAPCQGTPISGTNMVFDRLDVVLADTLQ